ncbi:MAG: 2,3-bisphosphoglycerate-independent phosphoglycerate mutase [Candidatus Latescibacteria bacterium]|nr:2,3-bisphosphoglycerate-independent phosphoglycerate mutase [Candidatus Latescibacterota bacterium]
MTDRRRPHTPLVLCILDGFGWRRGPGSEFGNAIALAQPAFYESLLAGYPHTTLHCHGLEVGLPAGQMGNSEVGHLTIGSGRVIDQDLNLVTRSLASGAFAEHPAWRRLVAGLKERGGRLHLPGLVSDGGVHSHVDHLVEIVRTAARQGVAEIYVHAFLDGRDTDPHGGLQYVRDLEAALAGIGAGRIATVGGRYYGMDRDKRWDRVEKAWQAMVHGEGEKSFDAASAIRRSYEAGVTDEFVLPTVIVDGGGAPLATVRDGDAVFFWNFRSDRARELTWAFNVDGFDGFPRPLRPVVDYLCMTVYDESLGLPVVFDPEAPRDLLADVFAAHGVTNLRIAETEKYAHVTYFFNGGREEPFAGEDRRLVPSPKVATYDLQPAMSAPEVAGIVLDALAAGRHEVIVVNFANGDMVGHTGVLEAAAAAVRTLDGLLARIVPAVLERDGVLLLTADHGNCEQMIAPDGRVLTNHTLNDVPFVVVGREFAGRSGALAARDDAGLKDIAPTMLDLLGLPRPAAMTGRSLLAP